MVFIAECGTRLAAAGYAAFGVDYEGHGRSKGAHCFINKFQNIVNDCQEFFKSVCELEEYKDKNRFLYGESMGGAAALLLHKHDPSFWNGAVLVAPMCKVTLPFFVLHGEADIVTDPEVSKAFNEKSSSSDKTIKLYPGMWHGLTSGEPDESIEIVFTDITAWLDKQLL
ncbi:hypothetical protein GOBAR_AA31614 [Gossypium barbadense]|uniref:Serine aminopeptidase S33 domain-containing protein n=1 Tax=Gossypium barbadense TaxID=3634 RepID=A0A2P5WDB7_GOSBA|nr:hypothetical protein GOBAR_AA31614 [Gossypium barbadense]